MPSRPAHDASESRDDDSQGDSRGESADQRHDRNWIELLNELRVTQTGVQIIAGFLLTLPFTDRFADAARVYRHAYLLAFGLSVTATLLIIAPISVHRALYQRHRKGELVHVGDRLAKAGLACLGATLVCVGFVIFGVTAGLAAGIIGASGVATTAVALWWILPVRLRAHAE